MWTGVHEKPGGRLRAEPPSVDTGRHMPDAAWQATYRRKCVSPEKALSLVARGDRVFIGAGCGEPQVLVRTLTERGAGLSDTEVYHLLTLGTAPYTSPRFRGVFRHNSFFIGPDVRQDVAEGRADYTPVFLSEVPALFTNGHIAIDKSLVQLSPPDEHGFCSYGVAVDITKAATESAAVRIAQVNRHMPRTLGDTFIHDNPQCEFHPSEYVNDPFIIGKNERMVAVNGALEVDLTGQVCSDSLGLSLI